MRWILRLVGGITLLVLVVVGVGLLLPESHRARSHALINTPADSVWAALTSIDAFPSWRDDVERVEVVPSAGPKRWREVGEHGDILYEQVATEPPRRLVTRIADPSLPFGGRWAFDIAADGAATRVTITEDGVVRNPIFRFMSRFVFGHHSTQESYLRSLGRRFGQDVTPVRE